MNKHGISFASKMDQSAYSLSTWGMIFQFLSFIIIMAQATLERKLPKFSIETYNEELIRLNYLANFYDVEDMRKALTDAKTRLELLTKQYLPDPPPNSPIYDISDILMGDSEITSSDTVDDFLGNICELCGRQYKSTKSLKAHNRISCKQTQTPNNNL